MVRAVVQRDFDYVLERERVKDFPKADRTVFKLRRLTQRQRWKQMGDCDGTIGSAGLVEMKTDIGKLQQSMVLVGLRGWVNFKDEDGNEIEFVFADALEFVFGREVKVPSDDTLDMVEPEDMVEISNAIQTGSSITVAEAGN